MEETNNIAELGDMLQRLRVTNASFRVPAPHKNERHRDDDIVSLLMHLVLREQPMSRAQAGPCGNLWSPGFRLSLATH
jgi:hypothetical protein